MNQQELQHFLEKLASGNYTNEEYDAFTNWMEHCSSEEYELMLICWEAIMGEGHVPEPSHHNLIEKIELGLNRIDEQKLLSDELNNKTVPGKSIWPRMAVAASILLSLSAGIYFFLQKKQADKQVAQNQMHDIAPGGNKAILTLAGGQKIVLDNSRNGVIVNQTNIVVSKKQDGQLVYNAAQIAAPGKAEAVSYDTLTTPRGGTYNITLADNSQIWLNAGTSLRYPAAFTGKYRTVELLYGEAYYEVSHNDKMPFRVIVSGHTIQDIGTHFNINAYQDEAAVKTTLLEGCVSVSTPNETTVLKPDQQAQINTEGGDRKIRVINNVDSDEIVAWKNGFFEFTNVDIQTVMRQLARWYDVEVVYKGQISKRLFTGDIHRDIKASEAMQILTYLKIDYKITGKKITITSN